MFDSFNCVNIDGELRVLNDLEVKCWEGAHKYWSMFVGLPGILIWGLGIPLFACLILRIQEIAALT